MATCQICGQEKENQRTSQQNRALHLYFSQLAEALNDAGYDIRATIKDHIPIPWTAATVKQHLWRPAQEHYLQIKSTKRLRTKDIDKIYDIVNLVIGERTGVYVPFPSIELLLHDITLTSYGKTKQRRIAK